MTSQGSLRRREAPPNRNLAREVIPNLSSSARTAPSSSPM
jgi:hypothetical protein